MRAAMAIAIVAVVVPVTAYAVHVRREERAVDAELARMTAAIEPLAALGPESRILLNGTPVFFERKTQEYPIDEVLANVARECGSGDRDVAFGAKAAEGTSRAITLDRIVTQEADGARASLCVFAPDPGAGPERLARVRYTLARPIDARTTSVTTIVNASCTPLETLFPAEGDAPGSDPPGAARPVRSRRTLTAIAGAYSVRVYESALTPTSAATSYDEEMAKLGYVVTAQLADARMYRRADGTSFVASFDATTDGSTTAIAPFQGAETQRAVLARPQ